MNFKKIALVVAMASSFSAHAYLDDLTAIVSEKGFVAAQEISEASDTAYGDFLTAETEANQAYVLQEDNGATTAVGGGVAYVSQTDGFNYAIVLQSGASGLTYVKQTGGGSELNKAMVVQIDTGTAARTIDVTELEIDDAGETLAAAEIATRELSLVGNVALIDQTGGDALNTAVIYQNGTKNFAAIVQVANAENNAFIGQFGTGMVAYVVQK